MGSGSRVKAKAWRQAMCGAAWLMTLVTPGAMAQSLPAEVEAALQRGKVPANALSAVVQEVGPGSTLLAWNDQPLVNPASLFKLVTTYAALDQLGPAWTWSTPVYLTGTLREGVLDGSVVIQGRGDPKLVLERVWLLLKRLQQQAGVKAIRGDILLDRSAFAPPERQPGDFDNEPFKPQNVQPDALMLNFKAVNYTFTPDPVAGVARISAEPALAGVQVDATVPLAAGPCDDWRTGLKAQLAEPAKVRFVGSYPGACGERVWPLASADPAGYAARLIEAMWRELGGRLDGTVREGSVPQGARLAFEFPSPALADVIRDINKFSNNLMAEQLFLSLPTASLLPPPSATTSLASGNSMAASAPASAPATAADARSEARGAAGSLAKGAPVAMSPIRPEDAREHLRRWVAGRLGEAALQQVVVDNGSGLSRDARVSAQWLARLLQSAWASPVMPELISSLPVTGTDGTLKRSTATAGRAHLKTGSLRDVAAVAGYVLGDSGRRYVLVAIVNHPNAGASRAALDALVQWAIHDAVSPGARCPSCPMRRPTP
ncbi:D-alanyl-D-alanine carboxypeptidase/D-alanyl-D-alanine-endopeptidase [Ideonella sp. DXS29W]|uniref:D-alanyl-D-alanine carboxypeptidase/D-alanyl-D-alanine-endopeptidase n=1 Tax=Ideonella lacteola TaxID=2984193 RepID=A0ABU9BR15_9BURK